ncbi:hypothetical protein PPERSA_11448 [Pseudocohnilembus persalinus]|uniref:Tetratricopeptide repeat protein n=1 Tax=Pseudocohnilembus persalinus TaxID=266149 RepID=A0A0V0QWM7_PSEPJ|nr:hypothetical protein PPERSA_11448 [Pseudocohnilembus persalinus]|eukprot:KRX06803.1 hypothetical protein PPERSA_11448 [Pseudocohnilembus persalinus]
MQPLKQIPDGQRTKTIYGLIKDKKYQDAIEHLNYELQFTPSSRTMSLLAYSYFMSQDYQNATKIYEQLVRHYPEVDDYKLYYAQSLYKEGLYDEALKASQAIENKEYEGKQIQLQILIRYEKDEIAHAKTLLKEGDQTDPDVICNEGALLFKEGKYDEARQKFQEAMTQIGYDCEIAYNIALCYYKMKQLAPSLKHIAEIIEKGVKEHPELGVGSNAEGIEVKSVGNSQTLKESALIEAFNLKAAIEYVIKNIPQAKEALLDMPPRNEDELDSVTLMNQALMNIEDDAQGGFKKLNYLLENPPFPPETFANLLLLYCKYGYYNLAADVLAENADLTFKVISGEDFEYVDSLILQNVNPEEAYTRFEKLANNHIDTLRKITKDIQDARLQRDNDGIKQSLKEFDDCLEKYIPVLMAQAKIYWDKQNYSQVQALFRQSAEFCADHDTWKLNVAHVFFVQDNKFREAIRYYEPIVNKYQDKLLDLTAIVIANLCVSYIMVNENEEAEELMKKLEREEERIAVQEPERQVYHLCIVNLVIGTLYCAKGNYEFGVSRVIKSLEPYDKKISTDTWFYAKRCFLSLIETMAKNMIILKDSSISEILDFLDAADQVGKNIPTEINVLDQIDEKKTVSYEARLFKQMMYKLRG